MTSSEDAQIKLQCLNLAERNNQCRILEAAKEYYEWVTTIDRSQPTAKLTDRGNSNIDRGWKLGR